MPYKAVGNKVYKHGKPWRTASSPTKAKAMVRALYASKKSKKKKKKR